MIVLASQSPRRKELMHLITNDFIVDVSNADETISINETPLEAVLDIAKRKGEEVRIKHPHDLVISADTIVTIDGIIIGKPVDEDDAKRILELLNNRTHQVITAFCLFQDDRFFESYVISEVVFNQIDEKLIDEYIKSGSPMDKAGAYGVQDSEQFPLVKNIKGSLHNVIGFPVEEIKQAIQNFTKKA